MPKTLRITVTANVPDDVLAQAPALSAAAPLIKKLTDELSAIEGVTGAAAETKVITPITTPRAKKGAKKQGGGADK